MTFEQARDYLLKQAHSMGIEAEVVATQSRELSLQAHGGKLEQITSATQGGVGVRVVAEGKTGYAYSEERSPAALDWVLREALENANLQSESGGFLPAGQALGQHDLLGEGLSGTLEEKTKATLRIESTLLTSPRMNQVDSTTYAESESQEVIGSTKGLSGGFRNGYSYLMAYAVMGEGSNLKQGWELDVSKEFNTLDPGRTALEFIEKTERLLDAKPLKTGRYRTYFEPKAFGQLLAVMGMFMLSAKNVLEGKSLLAGKLGQSIASSQVSLIDDPTLANGLASHPFDSEGTPAQRTVLIDRGVLKTFLHNSETAHKLQMPNTGHASRSYKGVLGIGPSNLFIQPGAGIQMGDGVIVTDMMGIHAGANPISGEFSLQALGLLVEGGKVQHAVENFTIAGNFIEMMGKVSALGDKLEWNPMMGVIGSPMVEVEELSFAGI